MTAPQRFVDFRRPSDRAAVEGGTLAGGLKSLPYGCAPSVGEAFQASRYPRRPPMSGRTDRDGGLPWSAGMYSRPTGEESGAYGQNFVEFSAKTPCKTVETVIY